MYDGSKAAKRELRKQVLARRDALPVSERIERSLAMADAVAHISFDPGTVISGFLPIRSEPDLRPLMAALRDRGARLCLPVVLDRETIVFRDFVRGVELVDTGFGTIGPGADADVLDPDIMLMPLAGFDPVGNRLGYGAGHYDRAIARLKAKGRTVRLIGTAFETQAIDAIPAEDHDVPLDELITETGLRSFPTGV